MAPIASGAARSQEVNSLDSIRPQMAKAAAPVNADQSDLRALIADAIKRVGSQKSAAIDMGIDAAQLTRQLQSGNLTVARLEALGADYAAELGRLLLEHYGPLATPKARAKQRIRDARAALDELDQVVELIS